MDEPMFHIKNISIEFWCNYVSIIQNIFCTEWQVPIHPDYCVQVTIVEPFLNCSRTYIKWFMYLVHEHFKKRTWTIHEQFIKMSYGSRIVLKDFMNRNNEIFMKVKWPPMRSWTIHEWLLNKYVHESFIE